MATSPPGSAPESYPQSRFAAPDGATEIWLIRHGQSEPATVGTPFPLVDGQSDPALSAHGRAQARRLADRLAAAGIDAIYVTTLRRTGQTAAPAAARLGLTLLVEPGLREVGLGDWEGGLYRKMVAERHPTAQQMWEEERFDVIPGAEPSEAFAARVRAAIGRLVDAHPGQRVAAFTHGGVIAQTLAMASGSRPFAFITVDNASISRVVVAGDRWIVRGFNDTAHLEGAAALARWPAGQPGAVTPAPEVPGGASRAS